MSFLLQFLTGQYTGHRLELPEAVVLGRAPAFGVALGDDLAVSTEHCRIFQQDGRLFLEDLGSTNGTEVNGQAILSVELHHGDKILIGATRMRVERLSEANIQHPTSNIEHPTEDPEEEWLAEDRLAEFGADAKGPSSFGRTMPGDSPGGESDPAIEAHPHRPHPATKILDRDKAELEHLLLKNSEADLPAEYKREEDPKNDLPAKNAKGEGRGDIAVVSGNAAILSEANIERPTSNIQRSRMTAVGSRRRKTAVLRVGLGLVACICVLALFRGCMPQRNMIPAGAKKAAYRQFGRDGVSLSIQETAGLDRQAEPVTSGVPLPEGRVKDVSELCLLGPDGKPTPCQFTSQCLWPVSAGKASPGKPSDGSIKWILLDFQADVGATNIVEYVLGMKGESAATPDPVSVRVEKTGLTLATRHLTLGLSTNLAGLIHGVVLNGTNVLESVAPMQAVLVDGSNRAYRASKPDAVTVESPGPMRATILVQGHFEAEDGSKIFGGKVGYDLRIHAYAGKPYVKLAFTLRNDGWYGYRNEGKGYPRQWLFFKSLTLDVPVRNSSHAGADTLSVAVADRIEPLDVGSRVEAVQWYKYLTETTRGRLDETRNDPEDLARAELVGLKQWQKGFYWVLDSATNRTAAKGYLSGSMELRTGESSLAGLAVRRFHQNFPAGLSAASSKAGEEAVLSFEMFPAGAYWPRTEKAAASRTCQLEGGRQKTAEFLLWFGDSGLSVTGLVQTVDHPLFARASTEWYRNTGAVIPLAKGGLECGDDKELNEAMERYDRLQRAKVIVEAGDPAGTNVFGRDYWGKVSIPSLWERAPDEFMGWMNYGDLIWTYGYCSLYYEWPYSMLQQYLRLGDPEFLDVAQDMIRHRYDIDQYHVENTAPYLGGLQRYERGEHGHLSRQENIRGRNTSWEANTHHSHCWDRGLLLHWALTGDKRSLEAAMQNGRAYRRFLYGQHKLGEKAELPWAEFRVPAWAMENWLALYEYTGNKEYLDWANEVFDKTLLAMERGNGSQGHIIKDGRQTAQFTSYMIEPVCRLHHFTGRKDAIRFLDRVLSWQKEHGCIRGLEKDGLYYPVLMLTEWDYRPELTNTVTLGATTHYNMAVSDGFAYLGYVNGNRDDRDFARQLFRDFMFYYGTQNGAPREVRTPVGYHQDSDPFGPTPKIHAFSGRYGQIFLSVEEGL